MPKFAPGAAIREYPQEEELADDGGEENENDKVIKLQRAAQGGQRQRFIILAVERSVCI